MVSIASWMASVSISDFGFFMASSMSSVQWRIAESGFRISWLIMSMNYEGWIARSADVSNTGEGGFLTRSCCSLRSTASLAA